MVVLPSAGSAVRPTHGTLLLCSARLLRPCSHGPSRLIERAPLMARAHRVQEPGKRECASLLACKVSAGVRAPVRGDPEALNSRQRPRSPWSLQVRGGTCVFGAFLRSASAVCRTGEQPVRMPNKGQTHRPWWSVAASLVLP